MATEETRSPEQHLGEDPDGEHDNAHGGEDDDRHDGDGAGDGGEKPDIFPIEYAAGDAADVAGLAEAERAVARHGATPGQLAGTAQAAQVRRAEERLEGWRGRDH